MADNTFTASQIYLNHLAQAMHGLMTVYPSKAILFGNYNSIVDANMGSASIVAATQSDDSDINSSYAAVRSYAVEQLCSLVWNNHGTLALPIAEAQNSYIYAPVVVDIVYAGSDESGASGKRSSLQIIVRPEELNYACTTPMDMSTDYTDNIFQSREKTTKNKISIKGAYLFFDAHTIDRDGNDVIVCRDMPMGCVTLQTPVELTKTSDTLFGGGTTLCIGIDMQLDNNAVTSGVSVAAEKNNLSLYDAIITDLAEIYNTARQITDKRQADLGLIKSKFTKLLHDGQF